MEHNQSIISIRSVINQLTKTKVTLPTKDKHLHINSEPDLTPDAIDQLIRNYITTVTQTI